MSKPVQYNGNVGFFGMLTILFIGLKLGKVITWSWWAVLSPLWLPLALALVIAILAAIIYGIKKLLDK